MTVLPFKRPENKTSKPTTPPMLNIPPMTLGLLSVFVIVHVAFLIMPENLQNLWGYRLAFVSARYMNPEILDGWAAISPITHLFLHGGWLHLAMNSLMLIAFGAAAERMFGIKRFLILFFVSGLAGAFVQFLISPTAVIPMIGASGALSGLFAAVCVRMMQQGAMPKGRFGIWGLAALWIGLSFITAAVGGAVGIGDVAWASHVGGFLAGIGVMRLKLFR